MPPTKGMNEWRRLGASEWPWRSRLRKGDETHAIFVVQLKKKRH